MNSETTSWMNSLWMKVSQFLMLILEFLTRFAPILIALLISGCIIIFYLLSSVKIINQGYEGIVERFGRYQRTLKPGLNFVIPLVDIVIVEDTREQILDIYPVSVISKDNVTIKVDAVLFWKILDVEKAYYEISNVQKGLENLVVTTLRSEIGKMELKQTFSSREEINRLLLRQLDQATTSWGVKVVRVEIQDIELSDELRRSLEAEQAAESERRARLSQAQGVVQAKILEMESTIKGIRFLSEEMQTQLYAREILQFLLAKDYIEATYRLGMSDNSKVVFMDPKVISQMSESLHTNLISLDDIEDFRSTDNVE